MEGGQGVMILYTNSRHTLQHLPNLTEKLRDFQRAFKELESWLLPKIARFECQEFMTHDLAVINEEIERCRQEIGQHRPQCKVFQDIADELMKHADATVVLTVREMLNKCKRSWHTLETVIIVRSRQLDDLQKATRKNRTHRTGVLHGLFNTGRRMDRVQVQAIDADTVEIQLEKLRPMPEIVDHQIDTSAESGQTSDTVTRHTVQPLQIVPHNSATELRSILDHEQAQDGTFEEPVEFVRETPAQREVYSDISRYQDLESWIAANTEDITLSKELVKNLSKVKSNQEWFSASDTKMERARPMSNDIPTLTKEIEHFKKKQKLTIIRMAVTTTVLISAILLASERTKHRFEARAVGTVTFDAPWTPRDGLNVFFTMRFGSEKYPLCTLTNRHPEGFKSISQYDRFKISYTQTDNTVRVTVEISDLSEEDAGVYILTLTSIDADNGKTVLLEKEFGVHQPRDTAQCNIHVESTDSNATRYAELSCRADAARGSPTLACYQHKVIAPFRGLMHNDGRYIYDTFWMRLNSSPIYCCFHGESMTIDKSTCRDFVWPPQALIT